MKKIFLLSLMAVLLTACTTNEEPEEPMPKEKTVSSVMAETAEEQTLYETCSANGNIRVASSIEVFPVLTGRVVSSPVKMGQPLKKGDVIAVIDPSINGSNYALHKILSPVEGNLLSIPVQPGTIASPENRIAVVGNLSELQIVTCIPERFYSYLYAGMNADVSVEAYANETFDATVKEISPLIDENSRTTEIILTLNQKNTKLCAGMFADITLYLKSYPGVLSVPSGCISVRGSETFVYTVKNGQAQLTGITPGTVINGRTIVTGGINAGDLVITEGFETLTEGEKVNVIADGKKDKL